MMKGVMAPGCTARMSPCSTWLMSSSWNICMSGSAMFRLLEQAHRGGAATRSGRHVAETHAHTGCCCDDLDRTGCLRSSKTWTVDSMRRDDPSLAVQLIEALNDPKD
ncbi:hypothetical protein DAPPUDRAFT_257310 [Daphnia pulex]|uniref:Uncharacterized protein n=1 Tax=Daphnia pulex TaxID=6669 RepID=E9HDB6_DAPPU|nr:hypothetical protein DAPPUDRAFT_257310 [Daphnia pulex]|eukprot:EFX70225.1 hypothetical protein DAPPUDRAFT_257310 [Daphnia pulex]